MSKLRQIVGLLFYTASILPTVAFLWFLVMNIRSYFVEPCEYCIGIMIQPWYMKVPGFLVFLGAAGVLWFIGYVIRK